LAYIEMTKQLIIFRQISINTSVITVKWGRDKNIREWCQDFK
jgi:hypothetical protein